MLTINDKIIIEADDLHFEAMRASGPGGQHVNKVSTAVRLSFDVMNTEYFDKYQKHRIHSKLHKRISKEGVISVVCQSERSQIANKQIALDRLRELLLDAIRRPKYRKPTKVSKAQKEKRFQAKQHHKKKKQTRKKINPRKIDRH